MAYTGEALDLPDACHRVEALAGRDGWQLDTYGEAGDFPLYVLNRATAKPLGHLYVSTGIHGDEPAGPLALLRLLEEGTLSPQLSWTLFPLLNPEGLRARTRENAAGADLNRDYHAFTQPESRQHRDWLLRYHQPYNLTLALHEDWESRGFYVYQLNRSADDPSLGRGMLEAVTPICGVDLAEVIEGRPAAEGLIEPQDIPEDRTDCPEQLYLHLNHTCHGYTLEAPSAQPLDCRVDALCAAVGYAQTRLLEHLSNRPKPGISPPRHASDGHEAI